MNNTAEKYDDGMVDGTCKWCGDEGGIYADTGYCEDCDGDIIHCSICDVDQHIDDLCRHVFRNDDYEWQGSGAHDPAASTKASFLTLLDQMPDEFAADLREAIAAASFHTWLMAPMIGGGGILKLHGIKLLPGFDYGKAMIKLGESERSEASADGYHWLASLYDDRTPKANAITISWIDEWLAKAGPDKVTGGSDE